MPESRALRIDVAPLGPQLEGRFTQHGSRAEPRASTTSVAVIAPPHPSYGGSIGNPVVRTLEAAFLAAGQSTLAFNFRGTGASSGEQRGNLDDAHLDYVAAARSLAGHELGWLSGYSFGSCAALSAAIELVEARPRAREPRDVARVLMVAPPLELLDPELVRRFKGQISVVVGDDDEYAALDALRAVFAPAASATIEVLAGVGHFFLGSEAKQLASALPALLAARK